MGENNYLSAYKLINAQLVSSNQKLKEDIKSKIDMINELNEDLFKYREENKTLRDMVQKLLDQFKTITTVMVSVRDQSQNVFNLVNCKHITKETEQLSRRPIASLIYEKRRTECPPYVDDTAIDEEENENKSMEDYRTAVSLVEEELEDEPASVDSCETMPKSPLLKRLERKSCGRSFNESFETINSDTVVKAARKSQEYLHGRDSRDSRLSDEEGLEPTARSISETNIINISNTLVEATTVENIVTVPNLEASSILDHSGIPSDESTQSDLNPATDQSLRPTAIKRMSSDSMLSTLVYRENKENTISNAICSTPIIRKRRKICKPSPNGLVPVVYLKPLTKENLIKHDISFSILKQKVTDSSTINSDQSSMDSNESKRPRRKAAPTGLKENKLNTKLRRT